MSELSLFDDLSSLTRGTRTVGQWCLVRWTEDGTFCGPISPLSDVRLEYLPPGSCSLGFPRQGTIGRVCLFDSERDAEIAAQYSSGRISAFDVPTRLSDLHFSTHVYRYYDGTSAVLYDDGDHDAAQIVYDIAKGRATGEYEHSFKISVKCRFLGTPPPRRLAAGLATLPEHAER